MGWIAPAMNVGMGVGKIVSGLFGGGMSPEEKFAMAQLKAQAERANQFWQQANTQQSKAASYYSPIVGGSRTAAMEALSPEIQSATQRMDMGRKSLLNLSSRSGGAAAMMDPYARSSVATDILMKARPGAAQGMQQMAGQSGQWAGANMGAPGSILDAERKRRQDEADRGASFFDTLQQGVNQLGGWLSKKYPSKKS